MDRNNGMTKLSKMLQFYMIMAELDQTKMAQELDIERRRISKIFKGGKPTGEELTKINGWMLS